MKVKLLGFKKVDFDETHGTTIWVGGKERGFEGISPTKFWVGDKNYSDMVGVDLKANVGKEIDVEVDLKGKLIYISA